MLHFGQVGLSFAPHCPQNLLEASTGALQTGHTSFICACFANCCPICPPSHIPIPTPIKPPTEPGFCAADFKASVWPFA